MKTKNKILVEYPTASVIQFSKACWSLLMVVFGFFLLFYIFLNSEEKNPVILTAVLFFGGLSVFLFGFWLRRWIHMVEKDRQLLCSTLDQLINNEHRTHPKKIQSSQGYSLYQKICNLHSNSQKKYELGRAHEQKAWFEALSHDFIRSFNPNSSLQYTPFSINGFTQNCLNYSGNFWCAYPRPNNQLLLVIGDSLKWGMPGALASSHIIGQMDQWIHSGGFQKSHSAMKFMANIHNSLREQNIFHHQNNVFSLACVFFDPNRNLMQVSGMGDIYGAKISRSQDHEVLPVEWSSKFYAGFTDSLTDEPISEKSYTCFPGDRFVFYTKGLIENLNPHQRVPLGNYRLLNIFSKIRNKDNFSDCVLEETFSYFSDEPLKEDVTVVTISMT